METYLVTIGLIFGLMLAGIGVDRFYRRFAVKHPHLGPFRDKDKGCGCCASKTAGCGDGPCQS